MHLRPRFREWGAQLVKRTRRSPESNHILHLQPGVYLTGTKLHVPAIGAFALM